MNFWNGIAPLVLALAVRSGSVGADSEEKLAEGRRKEGGEEGEGGEGAAPSSKSRNPAIGGKNSAMVLHASPPVSIVRCAIAVFQTTCAVRLVFNPLALHSRRKSSIVSYVFLVATKTAI